MKCLGATRNVTGSKFLIETDKARLLVDCGLFQEREFRSRNWDEFPVRPSNIDSILLTHAHIDHCGYLPKLIKDGFDGDIFCTPPTAEIAEVALLDAAKVQDADAQYKKARHEAEGRIAPHPETPLYTLNDARNVPSHFKTKQYDKEFQAAPDIQATFRNAGHILGAAMIELRIHCGQKEKVLVFSGDIGRWNRPILCDPSLFGMADCVFMESTYGDRIHEDEDSCIEKLRRVINETSDAGGNIVIPTFAIERAQELLYRLNGLLRDDSIPNLLIFLDSPMAIDVMKIFRRYSGYFDEEAKGLLKSGESLFDLPMLKTTHSVRESKAINHLKGTSIIMSGSGMCTGGRIKHHLASNIARPESTILFVGYQAHGTLGRDIIEGFPEVRILGRYYPVRARIEQINGFSAHADKNELLRWVSGFKRPPEKIFIVHGEEEVAENLAATLQKVMKCKVLVPEYLSEYTLNP